MTPVNVFERFTIGTLYKGVDVEIAMEKLAVTSLKELTHRETTIETNRTNYTKELSKKDNMVTTLRESLVEANNDLIKKDKAIIDDKEKITNLESELAAANRSISILKTNVSTLEQNLESTIEEYSGQVKAIKSTSEKNMLELESSNKKIEILETEQIPFLKTEIDTRDANIEQLTRAITEAETKIIELETMLLPKEPVIEQDAVELKQTVCGNDVCESEVINTKYGISQSKIKEILFLSKKGNSLNNISRKLGLTRYLVTKVVKEND